MNLSLNIPYNAHFSGLLSSFVAEISQIYGAAAYEKMQLVLAAEEIFNYILRGFPKEDDDLFHLTCLVQEEGLSFIFSNKGIPLNARQTADYCPQNVDLNALNNLDETMDSLGLALAKEMTDGMDFFNQGADGWQIAVYKKLHNFSVPIMDEAFSAEENIDKRFKVILAAEKQIPQLINLVYDTYRYSYTKSIFYDEEKLAEALRTGKVVILAAENRQNKLIGSIGLFFDSQELAEIGAVMTDPRYRESAGLLLLMKKCKKFIMQPEFAHTVFYVKLVTTHVGSQRLLFSAARFATLGFRLSIHKNAKFIGIDAGEEHRESLLYAAFLAAKKETEHIFYLPEKHKKLIKPSLDIFFSWQEGNKEFFSAALTEYSLSWQKKDGFVELWLKNIGCDFSEFLKEKTFAVQQNEAVTCLLHLPLDKPWSKQTENVLEENHYFFSGICLNAQGLPEVVYTNLFYQKFDFSLVKVYDSAAQSLLNYIEAEYLRVRR